MRSFFSFSFEELEKELQENGLFSFRAKQIFHLVYEQFEWDFSAGKNNLDQKTKEFLQKSISFISLTLEKESISEDGQTIKFLWKLADGYYIESVLIFAPGRRTLCVSSQVGCPVGCLFCASGKKGLLRNLSSFEILEQILLVNQRLKREKKEPLSHIVFMGMGEPLLNDQAVLKAIYHIIDPKGLNLSSRRITLSTVGIIDKILSLKDKKLKINLAISLHGANQKMREKLIPAAKRNKLPELLEAVDRYFMETSRDITFEYTLIEGVNDSEKDARELLSLARGRHVSINVIPYNPVEGYSWKRPSKERIERFVSILEKGRVPVCCRYTKGKDIDAACGQLALKS